MTPEIQGWKGDLVWHIYMKTHKHQPFMYRQIYKSSHGSYEEIFLFPVNFLEGERVRSHLVFSGSSHGPRYQHRPDNGPKDVINLST